MRRPRITYYSNTHTEKKTLTTYAAAAAVVRVRVRVGVGMLWIINKQHFRIFRFYGKVCSYKKKREPDLIFNTLGG